MFQVGLDTLFVFLSDSYSSDDAISLDRRTHIGNAGLKHLPLRCLR